MKKNSTPLTKTERFKAWNRAYTLGLLAPEEFTASLRTKMQELMKEQPERYEVMLKAFDYALREKAREQSKSKLQRQTLRKQEKEQEKNLTKQARLKELQQRRSKSKSKTQDRGR